MTTFLYQPQHTPYGEIVDKVVVLSVASKFLVWISQGGWNSEPSLSQSAATTDKSSVKTEREREVHLGWGLNGGVTFSDTMTQ